MKPSKRDRVTEQLQMAMKKRQIVCFSRPFGQGEFTGYVQSIGDKFFLLAVLDEAFEFLSHSCLRIQDVRKLQAPAKYEKFYKDARWARGDKAPPKIKVDLTDSAAILRTLHPSLVSIYREKIKPGSYIVGRTMSDDNKSFEFLEIGPDAIWETEPNYYRLKDITRIDLPGPYEKALLLVGGEPKFPPGTFE
jgi:hypothetical protein